VRALLLSSSVAILACLCWLFALLVGAARAGRPVTWGHVAITAALWVAAVGLVGYMLQ
jgi:hypothetical protein